MSRHLNLSKIALCLVPALANIYAVPAFAQEQQAHARGSVVISPSVGTGIAFDVLTDALSSVFLTGQVGDSVSLLLPPRSATGNVRRPIMGGGIVVLSTTSYNFDIGGSARPSNPAATKVNGNGHQSPDDGSSPGNLLFLAQFN